MRRPASHQGRRDEVFLPEYWSTIYVYACNAECFLNFPDSGKPSTWVQRHIAADVRWRRAI